jgi:hemin uptake protein HemP
MKPDSFTRAADIATPQPESRPRSPEVVSSHSLLGPHGRLLIEHHGERYVLRVTRHGRLILTK